MMEEGIIVRLNKAKKFAFIEREGKEDLHTSIRYIPDVEDGFKVTFEEGQGTDGRSTARKVKILARADGSPYTAGGAPKIEVPQEIAVSFDYGTSRLVETEEQNEETGEGKTVTKLQLPVFVVVMRGNAPVKNTEVGLAANGDVVRQPEILAWTVGDGRAYFRVLLEEKAEDCNLSASLEGKFYTGFWQKNPPQAVTAPEPPTATVSAEANEPAAPVPEPRVAKTIKVLETGTDSEGFTTFEVLTLNEDGPSTEGVPADYTVVSSAELEAVEPDGVHTDRSFGYETDEEGQDIVPIRPSKPGEATVYFRLTKFPAKMQGPYKVKRKEEVNPAAPQPAAPPKIERVQLPGGIYRFQITNAVSDSEVRVDNESTVNVEFRKVPCAKSDPWSTDKLTIGSDGKLPFELQVTEDRARGVIRFCIGQFRSEQFYVVHRNPPLPA